MSNAQRVADGMAYLDKHEPGWLDVIDLDTLDLRSVCRCVLGQLTSHKNDWDASDLPWRWVVETFGLRYGPGARARPSDTQLGFNLYGRSSERRYANLTAEWKRQIAARRAAGG